jgi:hypothetical protein
MKLFRNDSLSLLKPARREAVTEFLEEIRDFAVAQGVRAEYLVDVLIDDKNGNEVLSEPWEDESNPMTNTRGNLDVMVALMNESTSPSDSFEFASGLRHETLQKELSNGGLHSLHFRMGLASPEDRMAHTLMFADALFAGHSADYYSSLEPLHGVSSLSTCQEVALSGYFSPYESRLKFQRSLSKAQVRLLLGEQGVEEAGSLEAAVETLLRQDNRDLLDVGQQRLALRIEKALIPLVYNHGYRLKSEGISNQVICDRVSVNIDCLLSFVDAVPGFRLALKRQILINLFSPFADGLAMLNASAGELQGVMQNPLLTHTAVAKFFKETLCGPLRLFRVTSSAGYSERNAQVIDYFKETNDVLSFDVAIHGWLNEFADITWVFKASCESGYSDFLESTLSGDSLNFTINDHLLKHLMEPERLRLYSDPALMKLIKVTIDECKRMARIAGGGARTTGFMPTGSLFKERPHLREEALKLLEMNDLLNERFFGWCGFGHQELKMLGKRAPVALKKALLESAIGL